MNQVFRFPVVSELASILEYFGERIKDFALNWKTAAERVVFKTWTQGAILAKFVEKINNTLSN
jgi:hypothetical protein